MSDEEQQQQQRTKVCFKCGKERTKAECAKRQWKRERPSCRFCTEAEECPSTAQANHTEKQQANQTKMCIQCNKQREKDQFPQKQWKREDPMCYNCSELTKISPELTRQCHGCKSVLPRDQYDIYQWGKGADALCHPCRALVEQRCFASMATPTGIKDLPDGTTVCLTHSLECCDICMMDFTLPNRFARTKVSLGRDLTNDEHEEQTKAFMQDANIHINQKICIMDGHPVCQRTGRKLRCACHEVTYCSTECRKHHWAIHAMTCKDYAKKKKKKANKQHQQSDQSSPPPGHGLTEKELTNIRIEAFMAENSPGGKHSIEECAWQLGEHPLVIGGGSVQMSANGQEFIKGDVAKIYLESAGVVWDGSPRFGLPAYRQLKTPFDWIAKARQGPSQFERDLEALKNRLR